MCGIFMNDGVTQPQPEGTAISMNGDRRTPTQNDHVTSYSKRKSRGMALEEKTNRGTELRRGGAEA